MKYASPTSLLTISLILPSVLGISSFTPPAPDHAKRLVELGVTAGTCIDLGAKLDLRVAAATGLINGLAVANAKLDAGLCLCVDARTNVGVLTGDSLLAVGADINLYVQARADANVGTRLTGLNAPLLATSLVTGVLAGPSCKIPPSLYANSHTDFSKGCCGRTCNNGFNQIGNTCVPTCPANFVQSQVDGSCSCPSPRVVVNGACLPACPPASIRQPNGSCLPACPETQTRQPGGQCGCNGNNQILCQNRCYPKDTYTCPSGIPTHNSRRREVRYQCKLGKTYCPAVGTIGWDCIDTKTDIESCGGCADPTKPFGTAGVGNDCTTIPGTNIVSCHAGACRVDSCQAGWVRTTDGTACTPVLIASTGIKNKTQQKLVIMQDTRL